jgi:hypothetical protein
MVQTAYSVFNVSSNAPSGAAAGHTAARGPSGPATHFVVTPQSPVVRVPILPTSPAPTTPSQPGSPAPTTPSQPGSPDQANPNPVDPNAPGPLPANVSAPLQTLYEEYLTFVHSGASGTFTPTGVSPFLVINGTSVGVTIHDNTVGDFDSLITQLQNDGLQITASDPTTQTVVGMLPIANLPTIAQLSQAPSVLPLFKPVLQ